MTRYPLFKDLYGQDEAVTCFQELLEQLKLVDIYKLYNQFPYKGLLLNGPKGVGKTSLVKALINELEIAEVPVSVFQLSYLDIANAFVDRPIENLRSVFKYIDELSAKSHTILFIDEVDAMFPALSENTHEADRKRVNVFLEWLDGGLLTRPSITTIGATNNMASVHGALLRPGRFDKIINFKDLKPKDIYDAILSHLTILVPECTLNISYEHVREYVSKGYNGADATFIADQIVKHFVNKHLDIIREKSIDIKDLEKVKEVKPELNLDDELLEHILNTTKSSNFEKKMSIGFKS